MNSIQHLAWFKLLVVAVTTLALAIYMPLYGIHSQGCFGLLGFIGFGSLILMRRRGQIVVDERDLHILRRSTLIAQGAVWGAIVLGMILATSKFGQTGAIPVSTLQYAFFAAFMLMLAVHALSTLILYGRDASASRA